MLNGTIPCGRRFFLFDHFDISWDIWIGSTNHVPVSTLVSQLERCSICYDQTVIVGYGNILWIEVWILLFMLMKIKLGDGR